MQGEAYEQLVYTSVAAPSLDGGGLFQLVQQLQVNNARNDITGLLIFADGRFFQVIEGEYGQVQSLFRKIERDSRHHSVSQIMSNRLAVRQFQRWRMRRVRAPNTREAWLEFRRLVSNHGDALSVLEGFESYLDRQAATAA